MHLGIITSINCTKKQPVFGTFQWWRTPCSQDLLGWKERRTFCKQNQEFCVQNNINIGWTRNLSQILQLSGFKLSHFPPFIFSIVKITYILKVLRVANSDKIFFKLYTHCKNQAYLIV